MANASRRCVTPAIGDQAIPPVSPWGLPKSIKITYPVVMHHVRRTRSRFKSRTGTV